MDGRKEATVRQVPNGVTLVVTFPNEEVSVDGADMHTMYIAHLRCPKIRLNKNTVEPWGWEAREVLRSMLIGKKIRYDLHSEKEREYVAAVYFEGEPGEWRNLSAALLERGYTWLSDKNPWGSRSDRIQYHNEAVRAEKKAIKERKGMHNDKARPEFNMTDVNWKPMTAKDAEKLCSQLRGQNTRAIVEYVQKEATVLQMYIPSHKQFFQMNLMGILPPDGKYKKKLLMRTVTAIMHREVTVVVEGVLRKKDTPTNRLLGSIVDKKGRVWQQTMLEDGLATLVPVEFSRFASCFAEAERSAKKEGKGMWENANPARPAEPLVLADVISPKTKEVPPPKQAKPQPKAASIPAASPAPKEQAKPPPPGKELFDAINARDTDLCLKIIIDQPDALRTVWTQGHGDVKAGDTPLLAAIRCEMLLVCCAIIQSPTARVDESDAAGVTALMLAVRFGQVETCRELLMAGADVDAMSGEETPLVHAARDGARDVCMVLLEHGADVNKCNDKDAALVLAIDSGMEDVALRMVANGASTLADGNGNVPLILAIDKGLEETARGLLDRGADPNVRNSLGDTAFMRAIRAGQLKICEQFLTDDNVDIYAMNGARETVFHFACLYEQECIMRLLLWRSRGDMPEGALALAPPDLQTVIEREALEIREEKERKMLVDCLDLDSDAAFATVALIADEEVRRGELEDAVLNGNALASASARPPSPDRPTYVVAEERPVSPDASVQAPPEPMPVPLLPLAPDPVSQPQHPQGDVARAEGLARELAAVQAELHEVTHEARSLAADIVELRAAQAKRAAQAPPADGKKRCPWCRLDAANAYCARTGQLHMSVDAAKARAVLVKLEYGYDRRMTEYPPVVKDVLQLLAYRDVLKLPQEVVEAAQGFLSRGSPDPRNSVLWDWLPRTRA